MSEFPRKKIAAYGKWLLLLGIVIVLSAAIALTATGDPSLAFLHP